MFSFLTVFGDDSEDESLYSQADRDHLRTFTPNRSFDWRGNALEDPARIDTWREELQGIINGIDNIANGAFVSSADINPSRSPWTMDFEKPVHQLIASIAREDAAGASWDSLLTNGAQRAYLIRGVITKCLESSIFCEPLYGAHAGLLKTIREQNPQPQDQGPFEQAQVRAEQCLEYVRKYGAETQNFWVKTDEISQVIITMLFPLYNLIEKHATGAKRPQSRAQFHQDLHTVVAASGWLSISMRVHAGIMRWKWPRPGDTCDWTQVNADQSMWKASETHRMAMLDMVSVESLATAKVKIVVTPEISYNTLGTVSHREIRRSEILSKPTVVYYAGDAGFGRQLVQDNGVSLAEHVRQVRGRAG